MQRLQSQVVDAIRKDPDVTGVVAIAGVTPINATPNAGRPPLRSSRAMTAANS